MSTAHPPHHLAVGAAIVAGLKPYSSTGRGLAPPRPSPNRRRTVGPPPPLVVLAGFTFGCGSSRLRFSWLASQGRRPGEPCSSSPCLSCPLSEAAQAKAWSVIVRSSSVLTPRPFRAAVRASSSLSPSGRERCSLPHPPSNRQACKQAFLHWLFSAASRSFLIVGLQFSDARLPKGRRHRELCPSSSSLSCRLSVGFMRLFPASHGDASCLPSRRSPHSP